jgi:hypothetical protein
MELETRQFGCLGYELHDVIELADADPSRAWASGWLLLADKLHPHLYWLQSISDGTEAMPVCSLAGAAWANSLSRAGRASLLDLTARGAAAERWIALAEILEEDGEAVLNLERPILIDPQSRRGVRLGADKVQSLQHASSAKAAPLRKCA